MIKSFADTRPAALSAGHAVKGIPIRYSVGQRSVRINQRWRICFLRRAGEAVEIVDYHKG